MIRWIIAFAAVLSLVVDASAGPIRNMIARRSGPAVQSAGSFEPAEAITLPPAAAVEALAEVNAARSRRGLPAFLEDPNYTAASIAAANYRAANRIKDHTANDFAFLPAGVNAAASGTGGLYPSWGWACCCTYDNYRYAGAAVAIGTDGKRYMQLFVR